MKRELSKSEIRCRGKKRHVSERIAEREAAQWTAERGVPLYTYRCQHCKGYHLTRMSPSNRGASKRKLVMRPLQPNPTPRQGQQQPKHATDPLTRPGELLGIHPETMPQPDAAKR